MVKVSKVIEIEINQQIWFTAHWLRVLRNSSNAYFVRARKVVYQTRTYRIEYSAPIAEGKVRTLKRWRLHPYIPIFTIFSVSIYV